MRFKMSYVVRMLGVAFLLATLHPLSVSAQSADAQLCSKGSGTEAVNACTRLIAAAYMDRGAMWMGRKDYDRAVADYSEAIRLNPDSHDAFLTRGKALGLSSSMIVHLPIITKRSD